MSPSYEDDITSLHILAAWEQVFPTEDGIFAQIGSAPALAPHRSRVTVYADDDRAQVIIGEKHDTGYRRLIAERSAVLPMVDALSSGRLPYRFMVPNGDAPDELAKALQIDSLADRTLRWGPQLLQIKSTVVRRLRAVVSDTEAFVIVEAERATTVVYGGARADLARFGLLRHDQILDRLT